VVAENKIKQNKRTY